GGGGGVELARLLLPGEGERLFPRRQPCGEARGQGRGGAAGEHHGGQQGAGNIGRGQQPASEAAGDDRGLGGAETRAAQGFGQGEAQPAEFRHGLPQAVVQGAGRIVHAVVGQGALGGPVAAGAGGAGEAAGGECGILGPGGG